MKKKLPAIASLLLLLAAYAAYAGHRADVFLDEAAAGIQSRLPGVTLTLKERRWRIFYSVRTYRLDVAAGTFGQPRPLEADIRIWAISGPVSFIDGSIRPCLARIRASILLTEDSSFDVMAFYGAAPDLLKSRLVALLGFDGSVTASLDIPPAKRAFPQKDARTIHMDWGGLTATARVAPGLLAVEFDARAPRMVMADQNVSIECEGLSWTGRLLGGQGGSYYGRQTIGATKASLLARPVETGLELDSPSVTLDLIPKGETIDFVARASSGAVAGKGERVSLRAGATIGDLDAAAIARLPDIITELKAGRTQSPRVREWASALLKRSPWIAVEASLTQGSPDERADAAASVKTMGLRELPPHLLLALPDIRAEASFAAPPALMARLLCAFHFIHPGGQAGRGGCEQDAVLKLDALADQGILLREGGRLCAKGQWDGQAFTVNGRRF